MSFASVAENSISGVRMGKSVPLLVFIIEVVNTQLLVDRIDQVSFKVKHEDVVVVAQIQQVSVRRVILLVC